MVEIISEENKTKLWKRKVYCLFTSRKTFKRDRWTHSSSFSTLAEVAVHLKSRARYSGELFKFKIVKRTILTEDITVNSKDLIMLRLKHGI